MSRADQGNMGGEQQQQGGGGKGMGEMAGQLRDTAQQVGQQVRERAQQVRDQASEKYEQLRDQASEYYDMGRQRAEQLEGDLENYVREQPVKSLLIAAGVGLLLGILWKKS